MKIAGEPVANQYLMFHLLFHVSSAFWAAGGDVVSVSSRRFGYLQHDVACAAEITAVDFYNGHNYHFQNLHKTFGYIIEGTIRSC